MMNNFQLPVILQNQNQSMATKNRISLVSETSYLSVNEHRKTAEHAKLIV